MIKACRHCGSAFDPDIQPVNAEGEAGLILARERYGDAGRVCADCLTSRGRLAMMYDPECHH